MSLTALNQLDQRTAAGSIAAAIRSIRGPFVGIDDGPFGEGASAALAEARATLKLDPEDISPEAIDKIQDLLSEEVSRIIMRGQNKAEINKRLGERGMLPIGNYKLAYNGIPRDFGESKKFIEHCIRNADFVHHYGKSDINPDDEIVLSLFSKLVDDRIAGSHVVITQCVRYGNELNVTAFWRVFPKFVKDQFSDDVFGLLRSFAKVYKKPLRIGVTDFPEGWVENKTVYTGHNGDVLSISPVPGRILTCTYGKSVGNGVHEILLSYAIDMKSYLADKRKMGR